MVSISTAASHSSGTVSWASQAGGYCCVFAGAVLDCSSRVSEAVTMGGGVRMELLRNVHLRIAMMQTEMNEAFDAGKQRSVGFILKLRMAIGSCEQKEFCRGALGQVMDSFDVEQVRDSIYLFGKGFWLSKERKWETRGM